MENQFAPGTRGKCPHCGTIVLFLPHGNGNNSFSFVDGRANVVSAVTSSICPHCSGPIVAMNMVRKIHARQAGIPVVERSGHLGTQLVRPKASARATLPSGLPSHIEQDYWESANTLPDSPKASAALSRRCLQAVLREAGGTKSKDLSDQIEEVLPSLPSYLQQQLDAVRNIGNFAAHTQKSRATGEIVDVEPGEAEWNLDVLDMLLDFYYEQPRVAQQKRDALNKKLAEIGKPPMK